MGGSRRMAASVATNSASPKRQLGPACDVDMLILEPVKDKRQLLHRVPPTLASSYLPTSKWQDKVPSVGRWLSRPSWPARFGCVEGSACEEPPTAALHQGQGAPAGQDFIRGRVSDDKLSGVTSDQRRAPSSRLRDTPPSTDGLLGHVRDRPERDCWRRNSTCAKCGQDSRSSGAAT